MPTPSTMASRLARSERGTAWMSVLTGAMLAEGGGGVKLGGAGDWLTTLGLRLRHRSLKAINYLDSSLRVETVTIYLTRRGAVRYRAEQDGIH